MGKSLFAAASRARGLVAVWQLAGGWMRCPVAFLRCHGARRSQQEPGGQGSVLKWFKVVLIMPRRFQTGIVRNWPASRIPLASWVRLTMCSVKMGGL
jgi:hypothetical protein